MLTRAIEPLVVKASPPRVQLRQRRAEQVIVALVTAWRQQPRDQVGDHAGA